MGVKSVKAGVMERLQDLAIKDEGFRNELKQDPKGALSKMFGGRLPEDINFHVHEDDPGNIHIVLPSTPKLPNNAASMPHAWCSNPSGHSWSSCGYELSCYGPTCSSD